MQVDPHATLTSVPIPADEASRLDGWHSLQARDGADLDSILRAACLVCNLPIALVTWADAHRQRLLAGLGLGPSELPHALSFCEHVMRTDDFFEVEDTAADPRFAGKPLLTGPPYIRFFAGAALLQSDGARVGTLCVLGNSPHHLDSRQGDILKNLSETAARLLERHRELNLALHGLEHLEKTQAQLNAAAVPAQEAIVNTDPHGRISRWNAGARAIFGYSCDEALGQPLSLIVPQSLQAQESDFLHRLQNGDPVVVAEVQRQCKSGALVRLSLRMFALCDAAGKVYAYSRVLRDAPAQGAAPGLGQVDRHKRHSESELLYGVLNTQSIVSITDRHGNIIHANDAFCQISGYSRAELLGQDHRIVNSGFHPNSFWVDFWAAIHRGEAWRGDICNRAKNGDLYWVDSIVAPLATADGKVEKIISIRNDISRRKSMERELRESNELLETRVSERTQELEHALRLAESADHSRRDFLANTTHELRTPMNSVLGMTYLALKDNADPVQRGYLEKIQISAAYLTRIIDDILEFSKMDAGKLELVHSRFLLATVIDFVVRQSEMAAGNKGLAIHAHVDAELSGALNGDSTRIGQVLLNFVSNAIKFTQSGGIQLRALFKERNADAVGVRFEVQDTGMGIEPSHIHRLFSPFEQADSSISRNFGGTGLGLAISRQLATLMGGAVGVSSEVGKGSTFWMELRLQVAQESAPEMDSAPEKRLALDTLRGTSILVADDNEFNLDVARGILEDVGVMVATAANGLEAIEALRKKQFECVLMDVQMPVLDGLGATRQIRVDPLLAATLVIGLTANASGTDRDRCIASGMSEVIKKPIDPDQMFLTLAHWIRLKKTASSDSPPEPGTEANRPPAASPAVNAKEAPTWHAITLWDRDALKAVIGDNPQAWVRLLKKYLASTSVGVQEALSAIDEARWVDSAKLGHKLKSSSRAAGAMRLGALCEALERAAKAQDAQQCRTLGQQIPAVFAAARERILAEIT